MLVRLVVPHPTPFKDIMEGSKFITFPHDDGCGNMPFLICIKLQKCVGRNNQNAIRECDGVLIRLNDNHECLPVR